MPGTISQMQVSYNPEEDRILFRVNTTSKQVFSFWITHRYGVLLAKVLKEHLESDPDIVLQGSPEARQAIKTFKQSQANSNADFDKAFDEAVAEQPLGPETLLAFKLNYSIQGSNLHLGLEPKAGQGINMVINRDINASLTTLLQAAANRAGWSLEGGAVSPQPLQPVPPVVN